MSAVNKDDEREYRIDMEVIVDAYGPEEQALGWWCYLDDRISFPFKAICVKERQISPLREGEQITVLGMLSEDECMHEMFVKLEWQGRTLGVPLAELEPVDVDEETREAIGDWHYWVGRGYEFG